MADSIRKRILAEVKARIERVTTENGFTTDAGANVFLGVLPQLGQDDPDAAIAIVPQDMSPALSTPLHVGGDWPIDIVAVVNASENRGEPWLVVEDVLADIHRAIELEDRTFGGAIGSRDMEVGPTRTFGRESASEIVAVSQVYNFHVTRVWGSPDVVR